MRRRMNLMFLPFLAVMLSFCAGGGGTNDGALPAPNSDQVQVHVRNDSFWDANIYMLEGANRRRLGTVNGNSDATFVIPRHLTLSVTELRFVADYIGRRDGAVSETILAAPGDVIELTLRR